MPTTVELEARLHNMAHGAWGMAAITAICRTLPWAGNRLMSRRLVARATGSTLLAGFLVTMAITTHAGSPQTAWPEYMAALLPGRSESSVAAVLPPHVALTPPADGLVADRARWVGAWRGWAGYARHVDVDLVVEQASQTQVSFAYAAASESGQQMTAHGAAAFVDDELWLPLASGGRLAMRLRPTLDLEMTLWSAQGHLLSAGVLTQRPFTYTRAIERVSTPWSENGQTQTLEMVVYKPLGKGPFPTLILNHGSTGSGDKQALFTQTWTDPGAVRYFTDQGWQVMFPQRRGRGRSDGVYDEGFTADRAGYSCDPDRSLSGIERAMSDLDAVFRNLQSRADVDLQRLLIGGVSRGGILSIVYAGERPGLFKGVINFSGGWIGDACPHADQINPVLFRRGAASPLPTLWLYGNRDSFYSIAHSKANFDAFIAAGGRGEFMTFELPAGVDGHFVSAFQPLWREPVDIFLKHTFKPVLNQPIEFSQQRATW